MTIRLMRLCAVAVLLFAVVRLSYADPPDGSDGCDQRCIMAMHFVSSPNLDCFSYDPSVCHNCVAGRCVDPGPTLPDCNDQTPDRSLLSIYNNGNCKAKCTLVLNSMAQATNATGTPDTKIYVTWTKCE